MDLLILILLTLAITLLTWAVLAYLKNGDEQNFFHAVYMGCFIAFVVFIVSVNADGFRMAEHRKLLFSFAIFSSIIALGVVLLAKNKFTQGGFNYLVSIALISSVAFYHIGNLRSVKVGELGVTLQELKRVNQEIGVKLKDFEKLEKKINEHRLRIEDLQSQISASKRTVAQSEREIQKTKENVNKVYKSSVEFGKQMSRVAAYTVAWQGRFSDERGSERLIVNRNILYGILKQNGVSVEEIKNVLHPANGMICFDLSEPILSEVEKAYFELNGVSQESQSKSLLIKEKLRQMFYEMKPFKDIEAFLRTENIVSSRISQKLKSVALKCQNIN